MVDILDDEDGMHVQTVIVDFEALKLKMVRTGIEHTLDAARMLHVNVMQTHGVFIEYLERGREYLIACGISPDLISEYEQLLTALTKEGNRQHSEQVLQYVKKTIPKNVQTVMREVMEKSVAAMKDDLARINATYQKKADKMGSGRQ